MTTGTAASFRPPLNPASPWRYFFALLGIVAFLELMLMLALPVLFPGVGHRTLDYLDSIFLTVFLAPGLYFLFLRPLRREVERGRSLAAELARKEETSREAQHFYEQIFNSITDPITIHDDQCHIVTANDAAREMLRLQGTGGQCFEYFHGSNARVEGCPQLRTAATRTVEAMEFYEPRLGRHLEVRTIPWLDGKGDVTGIIHIARDISERKSLEEKERRHSLSFQNLYEMASMIDEPEERIKDFAVEAAVQMTGSTIGYLHFLDEAEQTLTLQSWSRGVRKECAVEVQPTVFRVEETGLWGEAVRQRRPVITNDYEARNLLKKGFPEGHVPIRRHMNIPLIENGEVVLIAGVGNKKDPYGSDDVQQLTLVMDAMWRLLQRKADKQALRASEEKYRLLFSRMLNGFALQEVVWDTEGVPVDCRFLEVNEAYEYLAGRPKTELVGKRVREIWPETENVWIERLGAVALSGRADHFVNYAGAHKRWYEVSAYSPSPGRVAVTLADVTERKRYENAFLLVATGVATASGAALFPSLVHHVAVALGAAGAFIGEFGAIDGAPLERLAASGVDDAICGLDLGALPGLARENHVPFLHERGGGTPFPDHEELERLGIVTYAGVPLVSSRGICLGHLVVLDRKPLGNRELTISLLHIFAARTTAEIERLRAEAERRRSEEHIRETFLQDEDALLLLRRRNLQIIEANPTARRLFTLDGDDGAESIFSFMDDESREMFTGCLARLDDSRLIIIDRISCNSRQGNRVICAVRVQTLESENEEVLFCSFRDMTEKLHLEEDVHATRAKLIEANKMASIGLLVSAVAHEINNPNQCIAINGAMLLKLWEEIVPLLQEIRERDPSFRLNGHHLPVLVDIVPKLYDGIIDGSRRITGIIEDMREFVRGDQGRMDRISDINDPVTKALGIVEHHIHHYTRSFRLDLHEGLPPVRCNPQQIGQVVINLVMNALQALPSSDRGITVITAPGEGGEAVEVRVVDEGGGMAPEVLQRIREPFFTTRGDVGGTGLGIYISSSIIRSHGGEIHYRSEAGRGTTATIVLPAAPSSRST